MADRLVINTGPLIALARAEALEVVAALPIEIIAPLEVQAELEAGVAAGHPSVSAPFVRFLPLSSALNPIAIANLDIGEAAVIQLDDWSANVGLVKTFSTSGLGRAREHQHEAPPADQDLAPTA